MCGICGWISQHPLDPEHLLSVGRMNRALIHRGPDDTGEFHDINVVLAMRRLSIIDLSGGQQPLFNENRSLTLISNGEIYNYIELRKDLVNRGHQFHTSTDCETILHLYEDHGLNCVRYLRGMFAFALWDSRRQRLMLARDRMGEKPLYLYEREGTLLFASELKSLLCSGQVPFELDPVYINQYFHYLYIPEPATPVKSVRKLDAARVLTVEVDPWKVKETCYWRMEDAPPLEGDPAELIRAELDTISGLVIRSDVPVGIALSGGLDSGALAVLTAAKYPGTLHAFSVGYAGRPPCDEREDARTLADKLKIPFHEVEISTPEMVTFFPDLVLWRDDPIADLSGYSYYAVMKLAREFNIPVMLQGQGGDELFWGYPWVKWAAMKTAQKAAALEKGLLILPELIKERWPKDNRPGTVLPWLVRGMGIYSAWKAYRQMRRSPSGRAIFYDVQKDFRQAADGMNACYNSTFGDALKKADVCAPFTQPQPWPPVEILLTRLICGTFLRENGITQGDRLSMASGIELRLPLLDYKLVETVIGLRKNYPDNCLPPKAWLKGALRGIVPGVLLTRPKKGFAPPVQEWHTALFKAYGRNLDSGYLVEAEILSPEGGRILAQGDYPPGGGMPLSFRALVLETWCRKIAGLVDRRK